MSSPTSVALFVHAYPPARGGVERLSAEISEVLSADAQTRVNVFTGEGRNLDSYKTLQMLHAQNDPKYVHRLKLVTFQQILANLFFRPFLRWKPELVPSFLGPHLNYHLAEKNIIEQTDCLLGVGFPTKVVIDAWQFSKKYSKPFIVLPAFHHHPLYLRNSQFQQLFDDASSIICLSQQEQHQLQHAYSVDQQKIKLITFSPFSKQEVVTAQKRYGKIKHLTKTLTIGYVGQIAQRKNLQLFNQIIQQLLPVTKKLDLHLQVILAGAKTETTKEVVGQLQTYIDQGLVQLQLDPKDVTGIYKQLDFFVHPSVEESFGIVNLEASYYGIPVLVHKTAPFAENAVAGSFEKGKEVAEVVQRLLSSAKQRQACIDGQYKYLMTHTKEKFRKDILEVVRLATNS